jgi:hypothetical protein
MLYACLVYHDERQRDSLPEGLHEELVQDMSDHLTRLRQSGQLVAAGRLEQSQSATTIRVRHGKMSLLEGPVTTGREQLGEFCVIEAVDLNDAIRLASRMPGARFGSIEVRPLTNAFVV